MFILTLRAGGGRIYPHLRHFLLYLCQLLFFRAETSWLFSFKPCAQFKTIFIKIGPRVMTQRCVIARWVQRKTDFSLKLHTNRVFFFFLVFQDTLPLCFILCIWFIWSKNMCKHTLTHIIAKNMQLLLEKIVKNHDFGDFRVFDMTSLMTSLWCHTRYVLNFFGTNGLGRVIAIH